MEGCRDAERRDGGMGGDGGAGVVQAGMAEGPRRMFPLPRRSLMGCSFYLNGAGSLED